MHFKPKVGQSPAVSFSPRVGHLHAGCAKDITVTFRSNEPRHLRKELFACLLSKIYFDQPINEVRDWDERMTLVKWVNEYISNGNEAKLIELGANLPGVVPASNNTKQIVRRKVIEVEPEPRFNKADEIVQPLELFVSANCDFCRYKCRTNNNMNAVRFKDTLMFQTRVYEFVFLFLFFIL